MEPLSRSTPEVPPNVTELQAFRDRIAQEGLANHAEIARQRREIRTVQQYLTLALGHPLAFQTDLTTRLMTDFVTPSTDIPQLGSQEKTRKMIERARKVLARGYTIPPIDGDPYEDDFDDAFDNLSQRWSQDYDGYRLAQQEHGLMILRQFHRITIQNPAINKNPYPRIPDGIANITQPTPPKRRPPEIS